MKETSNPEDKGNKKDFFKNLLKEKKPHKSEFIVAIIANLIFLYIVNNLLSWNLSFIAPSFQEVLWIFNLSIGASIVGNILFLIYHPGWFRSLIKIILNILSFMVAYYLYVVFPFILSSGITVLVKIVLILVMVVLVITNLVEVVKLILGLLKHE
ncbi:hypothetical protein [Methanobacterium sp. 42_16]|uniref:hypothetical protein n=1 Tax=Methanobacterium sp. 42_16 TaxID=1641383 RepID=UPI00074887DA|nr:hypothetical protein [Methanobacterium sp. 42_16]KUK73092.1 MAG: Uncharacterized protein XD90_1642 [Methanobacterium sp. 42_16]